jgi:hypothetical protein
MFPHADTVCELGMMRHQQFQAEAVQRRLAAQVNVAVTRVPLALRMRRRVGAALIALGSRIEDTRHLTSRRVLVSAGHDGTLAT